MKMKTGKSLRMASVVFSREILLLFRAYACLQLRKNYLFLMISGSVVSGLSVGVRILGLNFRKLFIN
jgi:hypothetical protein